MTNYHERLTMGGTAAESERDMSSDFDRWNGVDVHVDGPDGTLRDARSKLATVFETLNGLSAVGERCRPFATDQLSATRLFEPCRSLETSRAIPAADTGQFAGPIEDGSCLQGER